MGGINGYGYNVLVWLVGVVIRRYIDILIIIINIPYSTCIRSFFGSSILTSLFIFKCFFGLLYYTWLVLQIYKISLYNKHTRYVVTFNTNSPYRYIIIYQVCYIYIYIYIILKW